MEKARRKRITAEDVRKAIEEKGEKEIYRRLKVSFENDLLLNETWLSNTGKWIVILTDTSMSFPFRSKYRVCLNTEEFTVEIDEIVYTTEPELPVDISAISDFLANKYNAEYNDH